MSRSAEIPFSRSRTWTASTISFDISSALQQVAAFDFLVGDRDDPLVGRDGDFVVGRADQLAREALASVVPAAGAQPHLPADEVAVVDGLAQRPLRAG